jgi:hypothetical protein
VIVSLLPNYQNTGQSNQLEKSPNSFRVAS